MFTDIVLLLPNHKSMCLEHSEVNQYKNITGWNRERFVTVSYKEMGGSYPKN